MATEFKLPEIGEGTAEGEIIKWLVSEGDVVEEDTPLVEVMTDKATVEIPSPRAGKVLSLKAEEGEVVDVGAVIMLLGEEGEEAAAAETGEPGKAEDAAEPEEARATEKTASAPPQEDRVAAARARARAELEDVEAEPGRPWEAPPPGPGRVLTTPATRRLARELGVDLEQVRGSGKGGRIMKEDVVAVEQGRSPSEAPTVPASPDAAPSSPPRARAAEGAPGAEERIPFRGLRRKIAERMVEAKRTVPHFTYVEECDMTEIVALRSRAKELGAEHDVKVTYLPFIIRALIEAARKHPIVNSSLDEEAGEIVIHRTFNVGVATATERGLIVPVVHGAEGMGIFDLAREIERVTRDARDGESALEDLQGGTITITSTGNIGGVMATPIINTPEVAVLGVTAIRKRPVVRDDEIVIRHMLNLSLSLDHRIVDGADGALFMRDMIALLEDPKLLLLGTP